MGMAMDMEGGIEKEGMAMEYQSGRNSLREEEDGYAFQSGRHGNIEYAAGCVLFRPIFDIHSRFQIRHAPDAVVIAYHQEHRDTTKCTDETMLHLREQLLGFIMDSTEFKQRNFKGSLVAGFRKMDECLREVVLEMNSKSLPLDVEIMWRSCFNSTVMIIHKKMVYLGGVAGPHVVLCREQEQFPLTTVRHVEHVESQKHGWLKCRSYWYLFVKNGYKPDPADYHYHPDLFFYNEEAMDDGDMLAVMPPTGDREIRHVDSKVTEGGVGSGATWALRYGMSIVVKLHNGSNKRHRGMPSEYYEATSRGSW